MLDCSPDLSVGDAIRARYDESEAFGYVRYIRAKGGGSYLGISWDQRELPRKERKPDATFFINGPLEVVCRSCASDDDGNVIFKLWDGAEFSTSEKEVTNRVISEREKKLSNNLDQLSMLTRLYGLGEVDSPEEALERVIDFEFTR